MSKPDWKTKPHERNRMTQAEQIRSLKSRLETAIFERDEYLKSAKYFRDRYNVTEVDASRYEELRKKDVMVLDGEPKYLKGEDLDAYCDGEKQKLWGVSLSGMSSYMQQIAKTINGGSTATGNRLIVNASQMAVAKKLLQEQQNGNDTGSKSKEADQKDSGHYTDILRYAYWNRLRK